MVIKQLIPAPADSWVEYKNGGEVWREPIVCLGLVKDPDGYERIEWFSASKGSLINAPEEWGEVVRHCFGGIVQSVED